MKTIKVDQFIDAVQLELSQFLEEINREELIAAMEVISECKKIKAVCMLLVLESLVMWLSILQL